MSDKLPQWYIDEELKRQKRLDNFALECLKVDNKLQSQDFERRLQRERLEKEMENKIECLEKEPSVSAINVEEKLADEMKRMKFEDIEKLKRRQQLWETSVELRGLKNKFQGGYIGQKLIAQIAEKEAMSSALKEFENRKITELVNNSVKSGQEENEKNMGEALERKLQYKRDLQEQMKEESERKKRHDELSRDRKELELFLEELKEENLKKKELYLERRQQTIREVEEFRCQKEHWMMMEKQSQEEYNRNIQKYMEEKEREETSRLENKREHDKEKDERLQNAIRAQQRINDEKREKEEILLDLAAEDVREKELKRINDDLYKAVKGREILQNAYKQHVAEKLKTREESRVQDQMFARRFKESAEEELEKQRSTNETNRMKKLEFLKQIHEVHKDKTRLQVEEWKLLEAAEKEREAEEKKRAQLIEEERIEMVKKHAPKLIGYLPSGLLHKNDLQYLKCECKPNTTGKT